MKVSFLTLLMTLFLLSASGQTTRLGIVSDYPQDADISQFYESVSDEIRKTVGTSRNVILPKENILAADWNIEKAKAHYLQLTQQADLILVLGSVSIKAVLETGDLPKPTLGLGVFDADMQDVPLTERGTSGKPNFSYVLISRDIDTEIKAFQELVPFKSLTMLLDARSITAFNATKGAARIEALSKLYNTEINLVSLKEDLNASLQEIPSGTEAVYVAVPYERPPEDIKIIADYLIDRKLPSFSMSTRHVDQGVMSSLSHDNGIDAILRKLAIMSDEAIHGASLADMPVALNNRDDLNINMVTAEKIGYSPPFEVIFTANLVGDESDLGLQKFSLQDVIERALESNLGIKISYADIDLTEQDIKNANSQFLPDADLSASAVQINSDRANALFGQSEQTITGTASVQQLIFSEQAVANMRIQRLLNEAQKQATQAEILNILLDAYTGYFNVLQARTNTEIQEENLDQARKNLELAKLRVQLGASNKSDVFRFESEVANAQQAVVQANTDYFLVKTQLNILLNNTLGEDFDVVDVSLEDELFRSFSKSPISKYVRTPDDLRRGADFLISEAIRNHPLERQLAANIMAVDRQEQMNKRLYYTPTLAAQAQYDNVTYRGGEGSEEVPGSNFNDENWNVALSLTYPLFDGNRRQIDLQRTRIQQDQIQFQKKELDLNLSLNITAKVLQLLTAQTNINFSRTSSESAWKNFELVQENYKQGQVSIVQLIDAQRAALQAKQAYSISIYQYLVAHLELENAVGFYSQLASPEEQKAFEERFIQFTAPKND